jgi:hypothetical protein
VQKFNNGALVNLIARTIFISQLEITTCCTDAREKMHVALKSTNVA